VDPFHEELLFRGIAGECERRLVRLGGLGIAAQAV
jgi:hypothetical protein